MSGEDRRIEESELSALVRAQLPVFYGSPFSDDQLRRWVSLSVTAGLFFIVSCIGVTMFGLAQASRQDVLAGATSIGTAIVGVLGGGVGLKVFLDFVRSIMTSRREDSRTELRAMEERREKHRAEDRELVRVAAEQFVSRKENGQALRRQRVPDETHLGSFLVDVLRSIEVDQNRHLSRWIALDSERSGERSPFETFVAALLAGGGDPSDKQLDSAIESCRDIKRIARIELHEAWKTEHDRLLEKPQST